MSDPSMHATGKTKLSQINPFQEPIPQPQTTSQAIGEGACRIRVPASSGNMGPGYDTLGIALNLHNFFELNLKTAKFGVELVKGLDAQFLPKCEVMAKEAADLFFQRSGLPECPFTLRIENHIPIARGLASSATLRLAVLCGLDFLLKSRIHTNDLITWASELEGCTDNVAACFFGGVTASGIVNQRLVCYRFDVTDALDFVALSPSDAVETQQARTVFNKGLSRNDAVFTLNRGILLIAALARCDYEGFKGLFEDKIHQPQRQKHIPALKPLFDVINAGCEAGALGGFLSGSGSTMMAVTLQAKESVAEAMKKALAAHNRNGEARFLKADNTGLSIEA